MESYNFFTIVLIVVSGYLGSYYMAKKGRISLAKQRMFWNSVLLVSFLISGILGMLMAMTTDIKVMVSFYSTVLWLHVELGIIMATIAVFHFLWHLNYYKAIIRKKKTQAQ